MPFFALFKMFLDLAFELIPPFMGVFMERGVMSVVMTGTALEQDVGQDDEPPGLPEGDGSQAEYGGHNPVPEEHDEPSEEEGEKDADEDASDSPCEYSRYSCQHDNLL